MLYGLYLSAGGALLEGARHDVIANNVANVNTPGFRDDLAVIRARAAEVIEKRGRSFGTPFDTAGGGTLLSETFTRHAQGPIHTTGQPFDMAIEGEGFFPVTDGSESFYTRSGAFLRDSLGRLASPDGRTFLADGAGRPVTIPIEGEAVIARDGTITIEGEVVGKVDLARFSNTRLLSKIGANLYVNRGAAQSRVDAGQVVQGALEASSVSPALELARMVTASRGYEANMQLIRMQDQTLGDLVGIGRVSI